MHAESLDSTKRAYELLKAQPRATLASGVFPNVLKYIISQPCVAKSMNEFSYNCMAT